MAQASLRDKQMEMASYLRDPANQPPPAGVERRRLKIYEDLIYNNIEGFISGSFPVLRSLYEHADWHDLVRLFIDGHRCQSPYFLEISQEFIRFLMEDFTPREVDPPFIAELAHYEWVELALDVAEDELPAPVSFDDIQSVVPVLSPLAWSLSYHYPVHRIGAKFQPQEPGEPTYLVVYRDRDDVVQFMEINAMSAHLLEAVRRNEGASAGQLLAALAQELAMDEEVLRVHGATQLQQFIELAIVLAR